MDHPSPEGTAGSSPDQESASAGAANKRLRIVTRCAVLEEFLATFGAFADETSVFIVTNKPRSLGLRQPFVIQLKDGETIMRGDVEVIASITDGTGPDGRNGMRLRLLDADDATREVHRRLLERGRRPRTLAPGPDEDRAPDSVGVASEARPNLAAAEATPKLAGPAVAPPGLATIASSASSAAAPPLPARPGRPPPPRPAAGAPPTAPRRAATMMGLGAPGAPPFAGGTPGVTGTTSAGVAPGAADTTSTAADAALSASSPVESPSRIGKAPATLAPPAASAPATLAPPAASAPATLAPPASTASSPADERAPGAAYQLPANPFEGITAEALESFVECTLYEDPAAGQDDAPPPSRSGAALSTAPPALLAVPAVAPLGIPPPPPSSAGAPITMSPPAPTFGAPPPAPTFGAPPVPTFGAPPPPASTAHDAVVLAAAIQAASAQAASGRAAKPERRPWLVGLAVTAVASSVASLVGAYMVWGPGSAGPSPQASATPVTSTPPGLTTTSPATSAVAAAPSATSSAASSATAAPTAAPSAAVQHPCRANVRSYPEGASVSWSGESIGITPLADTPVPCGPAKVTFDLRGYAPGERSATAVIGKAAGVFLRLAPQRVLLEVTSTPPGAQLLVDARSMGRTPAKASLMGLRESTIVVTLPGYKPWTTKLTPEPPAVALHADLEKK